MKRPRAKLIGARCWQLWSIAFLAVFAGCGSNHKPPSPKPNNGRGNVAPDEFQSRANRAIGLMGKYQYSQAYALFAKLHAECPDDVEIAVDTAIARLNMAADEDVQFAVNLLETILQKAPRHLRANYALGVLKLYQGPPADPTQHFELVATADPADPDAAYLHAQSLEQARNWAAAHAEYMRCLALDRNYASALLGLSRLARQNSDPAAAAKWIQQFEELKSNPNSRIFEFVYKRMGKYIEVTGTATRFDDVLIKMPEGALFGKPHTIFSFDDVAWDSNSLSGLVAADLNTDGSLDLVVLAPVETKGGLRPQVLLGSESGIWRRESSIPWGQVDFVNAILCGDVDDNGRIDVYLCRSGENQLWLQANPDEWIRSEDPLVGGGDGDTTNGLLLDADHDGDLDIFCFQDDKPGMLLNNNRDGSFRQLEATSDLHSQLTSLRQVVAGDFDNDRDLDLYLIGKDSSELLRNDRQWSYQAVENLPPELAGPGLAVCVDLNHDGRLDLLKETGQEIVCFEFYSQTGWKEWSRRPLPGSPSSWEVTDLNGDGAFEIACLDKSNLQLMSTQLEGTQTISGEFPWLAWSLLADGGEKGNSLVVLSQDGKLARYPPGEGRAKFVSLMFTGKQEQTKSMRSNRSGIGTRWKAKVGSRWTTGMTLPASTLRGQSYQPTMVGTGPVDGIDVLAVDWSDGVFQTETGLSGLGLVRVEETQRQLASCPLVFAWNGRRFGFVTDILGVGGLGFLAAPGQYAAPRPWENLILHPEQLQANNKRLQIKIGEPMEEVCILAEAKLLAIELPLGWEVILDERAGITDPQPTGKMHFFKRSFQVVSATGEHQINQADALRTADGAAADPGPLDHRFVGLLERENVLEFVFDQPVGDMGTWALAIDGWIEYPYSQTVFAAAQAQRTYDAPTLEFSLDGQNWITLWSQIGYPAGMPRQMFVPLGRNAVGARHFRLRTTMQVYWDRVQLVELEDCPAARIQALPLTLASLRRTGFALRSTGPQFRPEYDYQRRSPTWDARHLPGFYTAFGDVKEQLDLGDPVVFGPGEEVHLEFSESELPPDFGRDPKRRRYVLQLKGWCKDMDLFTENSNELGAVPVSEAQLRSGDREEAENRNSRYESGPWYSFPAFQRGFVK